jgi:hypothetical protein
MDREQKLGQPAQARAKPCLLGRLTGEFQALCPPGICLGLLFRWRVGPPHLELAGLGAGELSGMDGDMHEKSEVGASVGASGAAA